MLRFVLAGALSVLALIIVIIAMKFDDSATFADLMFNLGTEIIGIAMTVAIVDWLIERNKMGDESQQLAWRMLHEIDQAIWVWQGGRQEFHLDELAALIDLVAEGEGPIESTQDLFVNLGRAASDSLRLHSKLFRCDKRLKEPINALASLGQMRALKGRMPRSFILENLKKAVYALADITGQGIHTGTFGVARTFQDSSAAAQQERYQGWRYGGIQHRPDVSSISGPASPGPSPT